MPLNDLAPQFTNPRVISTQKLSGLISEMLTGNGYVHETSLESAFLQLAIGNPSMRSIELEFRQQEGGWILSAIEARPSVAGAPTTKLRNDS